MGFLPRSNFQWAGLAMIAVGAVIGCWGGARIGEKSELLRDSGVAFIDRIYSGIPETQPSNFEQQMKDSQYLKNSIYLTMAGLGLMASGGIASRLRFYNQSNPAQRESKPVKRRFVRYR